MESDDEYIHRQYFFNATCGVVYNLSANILYGDVKQIDATMTIMKVVIKSEETVVHGTALVYVLATTDASSSPGM